VAAVPQILKNIIFTLGAVPDDFEEDVISIAVVPTPGAEQKVITLDGTVHQDVEPEGWAIEGECVIDWDSTRPGLAHYLFANKGTTVAFVVKDTTAAASTSKPSLTGTCKLVPVQYGGAGNTYATGTFRLPIIGDPVVDSSP